MPKPVPRIPKTAERTMAFAMPRNTSREVLFTTGSKVYRLHLDWSNDPDGFPIETTESLGPKEAKAAKDRLTFLQNVARESNIDIHERAADDIGPLVDNTPDGQMALV